MTNTTTHITTSGGLISAAFIEQIREADAQMRGLAPDTFAWPGRPPVRSRADVEARIAAAWERTLERWDAIHAEVHAMDVSTVRQRWLLPLFELLDFEPSYLRGDVVLDEAGKLRYPLSHRGWPDDGPVLHSVAPPQELDARAGSGRGIKAKSPHDMLQAFLNASGGDGWAVLSNGIFLRLLREYHHTFTKGYVQFDLEAICETRNYGDFRALYRMAHASRFVHPPSVPPASRGEARGCPLEQFYADSLATGIKVGDDLREQVREAIETLGNGFLATSPDLLHRLQGDDALTRRYYAEILHIIYRILFLLFAEQRGMMPGRDSLYVETYAISALRNRAERDISGGTMTAGASFGHTDLWEGLKVTFKMVREGAPDLGVTQYNGMLFAADQTPLIGAPRPSTLRNGDLLRAIRALTLIEREGVLQRISYADLGVEELGSIYESLLDFTPRIPREREVIAGREIPPYTFVLDPRGSERKTTGSYYTHDSLVHTLLESALLPVARERLAAAGLPIADPTEEAGLAGLLADYAGLTPAQRDAGAGALLDLKICDPAAGSGHFLVKANNVLGAELARIRSGDAYPTEAQVQAAKRDVLAHSLYAVDLNPMAVELCKVSLWINASVRDEPLNFLDHHIKCGNSLVGATPDLLAEGVPYEAFALGRAGDDRELAKRVRKQNRQERRDYEKGGAVQLTMEAAQFQVTQVLETPEDIARWAALNALAETAPQAARERYTAYQTDEKTAHAKLVADTWTAAFFWPLTPDAPDPPTFDTFYQVREKGRDALTEDQQRMVAALAEKHRFLHWRLAFPDVFTTSPHTPTAEGSAGGSVERSGFDVILGNPPWERIKVQEKEFFADKAPEIANARTAAQRRKLIKRLPASDPALHAAYIDALRGSEALSTYLRESGRYPLSAAGDINTYQIFAGLVRQIVDGRGRVGIVVPTGIATDYYNQDYFAALIDNRELVSLYDFENRQGIFPGVHRSYKFSLLTLTGAAMPADEAEFAFFLHQVDDLADDERRFTLSAEDLARINPNTKTCPIFRTRHDAELTAKLYRAAPVLVNEMQGTNPWDVSFLRMLDMTNDSHLFHTRADLETQGFRLGGNRFVRDDEVYLPLYEAKMFWHYDHRFGSYQDISDRNSTHIDRATSQQYADPSYLIMPWYWVAEKEVKERLLPQPRWVLAFRDITNVTNERTSIFTILPWTALGNNAPIVVFSESWPLITCGLLANLCSFPFDFVARQKLGGTHMNFYILEQLPVLPPDRYTSDHLHYIVPRVLELTYTAWDLQPFADDVWREAQSDPTLTRALLDQWEANQRAVEPSSTSPAAPSPPSSPADGWPHPPFTWDERRRSHLRADLDALYAHLYHLTREELAYLLDTFPIVKRKDEAEYGEYRTKRLVLERYEEITTIRGSGDPL